MKRHKKQLLILGGGFGGVKTALQLATDNNFEVKLVSDSSNFSFHAALYKTATGGREIASSIPLTEIFAGKKVQLIHDTAQTLDRSKKTLRTGSGKTYAYDILVIALGAVTNFFGIKGLEQYAYGIKSLDEARKLRQHLHKQMLDEQKPDLNYVVVGGGPTGVELAGALPGYLRRIMKNHRLLERDLSIDLVEAKDRLLPAMPRAYSRAVARRLRKLGVKLYLDQKVEAETADSLKFGNQLIGSQTVIWTAGVTNHPFLKDNGFTLSKNGRALVGNQLQAADDIYVIGDNADTPYSGMAQTALHDAKFVAENLKRQRGGEQALSYKPKKPIYITPVGPRWAAVLWGNRQIYGWAGWWLRNLADFAGYHQYEPWWKAGRHLQAGYETEETCVICK